MSAPTQPGTDRTAKLRAELVATVNAEPYVKRGVRPRMVAAAIAAFALAGAATGGVITSAALAAPPEATTVTVEVDADAIASRFILKQATPIGSPFIISSRGQTVVELGTPPEGANSIAVDLECLDPGTFTVKVTGFTTTYRCTQEDVGKDNSGDLRDIDGTDEQTVTVDSSGRYTVWASWAYKEPEPELSAAQTAELADGQVTREEYEAAFDRFASCMADAGHPLLRVDRSRTLIDYSLTDDAVYSKAEPQCYVGEFRDVDIAWQLAHQDTSESAKRLRECLTAAGIAPAPTSEENTQKLKDAGIYDLCVS